MPPQQGSRPLLRPPRSPKAKPKGVRAAWPPFSDPAPNDSGAAWHRRGRVGRWLRIRSGASPLARRWSFLGLPLFGSPATSEVAHAMTRNADCPERALRELLDREVFGR